ncbi:MAG: hypothetical protein HLUCCX10_03505 [Algoriphagus marincola HL-49]|uniref:Pycsar effector protein domain-containing protein n=1 Tax=Algoriphagus marincola HL-49 TaxID=1305737 RepID=A0A0P7YU38_9BACT|nr:MAG: hypothetical protein HLUCCX10_03505 [Algoriphagus marincola HL-49]
MENQKEIEDKLWKIFANVNDWLKVAEAKNAMLIGFNGACIFAASRIINFTDSLFWCYLVIGCILLVGSLIISLLTFVPRLADLPFSSYSKTNSENSFFFEYLKTLTKEQLLEKHFKRPDEGFPTALQDLAEQIINNSKISSLKYSYFSVAIWFTIGGIVTPIIGLIVFGFWYSHQIRI